MRYLLVLSLLIISKIASAEGGSVAGNCANYSAKLVSLQGALLIAADSQGHWRPGQLNQTICQGSQVHVQPYSRASLLLPGGIILRMDEGTVLTINGIDPEKPTLLNLLKGFIHFISRTPRQLQIDTPIANAGPEGTEFAMRVDGNKSSLWVYEGKVKFYNAQGDVRLKPGEAAQALAGQAPQAKIDITPQDAVNWALYYPPILPYPAPGLSVDNAIRTAIDDFRRGRTSEALARMDKLSPGQQTPYFYKVRAAMRLTLGRIELARQDIQALLAANPKDADALAMQSVMTLTQNRKDEAYQLAQRAVTANPQSSTAYSALSYAEQGRFDLDKALKAAEKAANLAPQDAMMWARKAELELSLGETSGSQQAAKKALELDPNLERTQTVMGFTHLLRMDVDDALTAFNQAVELDSTSPLARLGLGLAKIRNGDLEDGRKDLEIAAILDPNNSIVRSYLGKAYYEERRSKLADEQYKLAKERDPKDPTPYFYDAINKQTTNRPVEALQDMQKAIELNDNRGVYRSKLMLDSDSAARSASLGRIYNDLGFQQRGLVESWKSINSDPSNHSAHRLLSDNYVALPRHEIARVSELLQSQLLQPINLVSLQPQLSQNNLNTTGVEGPSILSVNEFNPLYSKDGVSFVGNGKYGSNNLWSEDAIISGLYKNISTSFGQNHFETDGFQENADLKQDIYNAFLQAELTNQLSAQAQVSRVEIESGDIITRANGYRQKDFRQNILQDTARVGFHYKISPNQDIVASGIYQKYKKDELSFNFPPPTDPAFGKLFGRTEQRSDADGFYGEIQHIFRNELGNSIFGIGYLEVNSEDDFKSFIVDVPSLRKTPFPPGTFTNNEDISNFNAYLYESIKPFSNLTTILGLSFDAYRSKPSENSPNNRVHDVNKINPKFGFIWEPTKTTTVRGAVFKVLKRPLAANRTIEPTQVAGFNQFFDDFNADQSWRYGIGLDQKISSDISFGFELSWRDLNRLIVSSAGVNNQQRDEIFHRAYFNWTPHPNIAINTEFRFEDFNRDFVIGNGNLTDPQRIKTFTIPLSFSYFDQSGFIGKISATYVDQKTRFVNDNESGNFLDTFNNNFWVIDTSIGYRLPKRYGQINLGVSNLLDNRFLYQSAGVDTQLPQLPKYQPERTFFISFNLSLF